MRWIPFGPGCFVFTRKKGDGYTHPWRVVHETESGWFLGLLVDGANTAWLGPHATAQMAMDDDVDIDWRREYLGLLCAARNMLSSLGTREATTVPAPENAPGHSHPTPGIWDVDTGDLAGSSCRWCRAWYELKEKI